MDAVERGQDGLFSKAPDRQSNQQGGCHLLSPSPRDGASSARTWQQAIMENGRLAASTKRQRKACARTPRGSGDVAAFDWPAPPTFLRRCCVRSNTSTIKRKTHRQGQGQACTGRETLHACCHGWRCLCAFSGEWWTLGGSVCGNEERKDECSCTQAQRNTQPTHESQCHKLTSARLTCHQRHARFARRSRGSWETSPSYELRVLEKPTRKKRNCQRSHAPAQ
jgi:hypothetical protein